MRLPRSCASLLLCLLLPAPASAGECRTLLRPLLLQASPPAEVVASVRENCERESRDGDPDATYQLALFSLGLAGVWKPDEAIPLIRSAAAQGVSEAQYWLGWQAELGLELPNDPEVARYWYEQAALGRHRLALERMAVAYEQGELGLTADARAALDLRAEIRRCDEEAAALP